MWVDWAARGYADIATIFPPVIGTLCLTVGVQTIMGGFLLAIIAGNDSRFVPRD